MTEPSQAGGSLISLPVIEAQLPMPVIPTTASQIALDTKRFYKIMSL